MTTATKTKSEMTPGPWEVDSGMVQTVAEHSCKTPGCGVHIPIAYMDREPGNGTMPVERDANARAIAAVPDLIAALQGCIHHNENTKPAYQVPESLMRHIRQALIKAGVL